MFNRAPEQIVCDLLAVLEFTLGEFQIFLGDPLHHFAVALRTRVGVSGKNHPVHNVHGHRRDFVASFRNEALEGLFNLSGRPHLKKWVTKVPYLLPLLFEQPSSDHFASEKVVLIIVERSFLESQMRESVITQFDSAVGPGFQDLDPRVGLSGDLKERFIDESHDRNLMFIDRRQNLVGHRPQSSNLKPRAVEREIVYRYGDLFLLRDGLRLKTDQTSRPQPDNQNCQTQEVSSHSVSFGYLGTHRFQRAEIHHPEIDRMSEMTNARTLEAMRTQGDVESPHAGSDAYPG